MRDTMIAAMATGILAAGLGCGGSGGGALSVSARAVVPAAAPAQAASLDLGDGISVARVRLALRHVELEETTSAEAGGASGPGTTDDHGGSGGGSDDGGSGGGSDDAGEVEVGPLLVDLSGDALASGRLDQVLDADVRPGTYRELSIVVGPVVNAADAGLAALDGASVAIDGTIDGAAFTFTSSLVSVQKREALLVVSAGGGSSNVTLTVDPGGWFRAADGSRLDPRAAASRGAIEANVAASIDAFGDDDGDGHEDGGDDGAGHR